jgi:hypothetical protein
MRDGVSCDALELISPAVAGRLSRTPAQAGWTLLVRVLGGTAAVDDALVRLHTLAGPIAGRAHQMTDVPAAIWTALSNLEVDARMAIRLTGPATALHAGLQSAVSETPAHPDAARDGWLIAAHAADGVIRMWRRTGGRSRDDDPAGSLERLAATSATVGWTMRYDTIRAGGRAAPRPDGTQPDGPDPVRTLTRRIRNVFDPAGILAG